MACGQKKQNNQGGVHLTERTCSPYNPIIKLIVDDCLGLPIYPVTSVDAVIDEDGNTLRKLLDELLTLIKEGAAESETQITEILTNISSLLYKISSMNTTDSENGSNVYSSTYLGKPYIVEVIEGIQDDLAAITGEGGSGLSLPDVYDKLAVLTALLYKIANFNINQSEELDTEHAPTPNIIWEILQLKNTLSGGVPSSAEVEELKALVWAISALSYDGDTNNETNLYDTTAEPNTTPTIVSKIKELLKAVEDLEAELGSGSGETGIIGKLKTLLIAVAGFDDTYTDTNFPGVNSGRLLAIIKEILDIKAAIGLSSDPITPNENGSILEKIQWLINHVNDLISRVENLEKYSAHLDSNVVIQCDAIKDQIQKGASPVVGEITAPSKEDLENILEFSKKLKSSEVPPQGVYFWNTLPQNTEYDEDENPVFPYALKQMMQFTNDLYNYAPDDPWFVVVPDLPVSSITDGTCGPKIVDLDNDGFFGVSDITKVSDVILGHADLGDCDFNCDGETNIADINTLIRWYLLILSGNYEGLTLYDKNGLIISKPASTFNSPSINLTVVDSPYTLLEFIPVKIFTGNSNAAQCKIIVHLIPRNLVYLDLATNRLRYLGLSETHNPNDFPSWKYVNKQAEVESNNTFIEVDRESKALIEKYTIDFKDTTCTYVGDFETWANTNTLNNLEQSDSIKISGIEDVTNTYDSVRDFFKVPQSGYYDTIPLTAHSSGLLQATTDTNVGKLYIAGQIISCYRLADVQLVDGGEDGFVPQVTLRENPNMDLLTELINFLLTGSGTSLSTNTPKTIVKQEIEGIYNYISSINNGTFDSVLATMHNLYYKESSGTYETLDKEELLSKIQSSPANYFYNTYAEYTINSGYSLSTGSGLNLYYYVVCENLSADYYDDSNLLKPNVLGEGITGWKVNASVDGSNLTPSVTVLKIQVSKLTNLANRIKLVAFDYDQNGSTSMDDLTWVINYLLVGHGSVALTFNIIANLALYEKVATDSNLISGQNYVAIVGDGPYTVTKVTNEQNVANIKHLFRSIEPSEANGIIFTENITKTMWGYSNDVFSEITPTYSLVDGVFSKTFFLCKNGYAISTLSHEKTNSPVIHCTYTSTNMTISVTGNGTLTLYVNGEQKPSVYQFPRAAGSYYVCATAQELNKESSDLEWGTITDDGTDVTTSSHIVTS